MESNILNFSQSSSGAAMDASLVLRANHQIKDFTWDALKVDPSCAGSLFLG